VLGLDVSVQHGVLHVVEHKEAAPAAAAAAPRDWFTQALALESTDVNAALAAYGEAVAADPGNAAAWTNLGRLLHEAGRTQEAADVYERALGQAGADSLLLFNQGVLLEDLGDAGAALQAYQGALEEDPDFADCHYNLARLYESMGKPQHAIRHLGRYRRLVSSEGR
jgi:tetratricopeptide (TPR) repeat protein